MGWIAPERATFRRIWSGCGERGEGFLLVAVHPGQFLEPHDLKGLGDGFGKTTETEARGPSVIVTVCPARTEI